MQSDYFWYSTNKRQMAWSEVRGHVEIHHVNILAAWCSGVILYLSPSQWECHILPGKKRQRYFSLNRPLQGTSSRIQERPKQSRHSLPSLRFLHLQVNTKASGSTGRSRYIVVPVLCPKRPHVPVTESVGTQVGVLAVLEFSFDELI